MSLYIFAWIGFFTNFDPHAYDPWLIVFLMFELCMANIFDTVDKFHRWLQRPEAAMEIPERYPKSNYFLEIKLSYDSFQKINWFHVFLENISLPLRRAKHRSLFALMKKRELNLKIQRMGVGGSEEQKRKVTKLRKNY